MPVTMREVLDTDAVRAGVPEVLSGGATLERTVRWVHVSEVPDVTGLLRGGELVLTTGIAIAGGDPVRYLDMLVDAGATGLMVELGGVLPALPEPLVARARERDFAVVALHATTRFVDVTEHVHRSLVSDQFESVRFAQRVHERFTELSLDAAGADEIVAVAAELGRSSVVLEDAGRRVVSFAAQGRPESGLLADWERRSRLAGWSARTELTGPEGWMATPVGVGGQHWARLVATDPRMTQERLTQVIERAAQTLELGRRVERDRTGLHLQAQGGLLGDLASGRLVSESDAAARAQALGLVSARWHTPVVVHQPPVAGDDPVAAHRRARRLVERVADAARTASVPALVGRLSEREAGLLVALGSETDEDDALGALAEALADPGSDAVGVGAGPGGAGLVAASDGLATARHVAEVAGTTNTATGTGRPFVRAADVRLTGLVALLRDDPRVQAFAEAELDALLAREARHGGDLVEILRQYVAAGGNKTELARATHRNRPALYKKLAQIERILGVRLGDPDSLLSLGVAFLVHDQRR